MRHPDRPTLFKCLPEFQDPDSWQLEIENLAPVTLRVVESPEFHMFRHAGVQRDRSLTARSAIARAIASTVEGRLDALAEFLLGNKVRQPGFDPTSAARLLEPLRHRALAQVREAIETGGYKKIVALAETERGSPAPCADAGSDDRVLSPDDLEALCGPSPSRAEDPLRRGWESAGVPSDRALKKAVKYVFGQGWSIDIDMTSPPSLILQRSYRFAPHERGDHAKDEDDRARTAVFRTVGCILDGADHRLMARMLPEAEGQSLSADEIAHLLRVLQDRLRETLLEAIDQEGYEGLVRIASELGR